MIPRPPFSLTYKRLHWLLGYLRTSECEESGNQPTREFSFRNKVLSKNAILRVLIFQLNLESLLCPRLVTRQTNRS